MVTSVASSVSVVATIIERLGERPMKRSWTRRQFVGTSLGAIASAIAVPKLLRAEGANEKIGIAIVGVRGRRWRTH